MQHQKNTNLQKISLSPEFKNLLETRYAVKIHTSNVFKGNDKLRLDNLLNIGLENSLNYIKRKKLGHVLSYMESNQSLSQMSNLQKLLNLKKIPKRMECYDISHISGTYVYGSMVVFINGIASKKDYRIFKLPNRNDDFLNLKEVLSRRIIRSQTHPDTWKLPDLFVIDGGKGQLSSICKIFEEFKINIDVCSLAKRIEEVFTFINGNFERVLPDRESKFLLERIRNEAHRFAITTSGKAKLKSIKDSHLDSINGIGSKTKKRILEEFGSIQNLIKNMDENPAKVEDIVGSSIFRKLKIKFG